MTQADTVDRTLRTSNLPAYMAMASAMVSVQIGASLGKQLFPAVGAEGATALRVMIGAIILIAILRPWRSRPERSSWPALVVYGATLGVMNLLFYSALQTIPLGVAVALEFTGPLGVALMASRRILDFVWIAIATAGLLTLLPLWHQPHPLQPLGIAFALGAGLCWAIYIVAGKKAGSSHGAQSTAIGMAIAAAITFPIGLLHAGASLFAPSLATTALGVAVLSSVLPYSLEMFALPRIPVRVFGTLMSVEPAIAALMGRVLLHETLSWRQTFAIGAIMIAALGVALGAHEKSVEAGPA